MPTISNTPRPAYIYEAATDQWIPVGFGPHTHAVTDVTNAFNTTTVTTKGDLVVAAGSNNITRLAAGANGESLVADSTTTTGLRWVATPSASNPVINSAFQIAQRGASVSVPASTLTYTLDRWRTATGTNQACTVARVATGDTTNLPFIQYAMRYQRNSGQTGTGGQSTYQDFETINSIPYSGKTVTISVYARKGADYSPTSSILQFNLVNGTGTDQTIYSGYTGQNTVMLNTMTLTTTWQRFTYTATIPTNSTQLALGFGWQFQGTAGTNDYFEVTGVQIDVGNTALPFRTNGGTIQGELAACQRYFIAYTPVANYQDIIAGGSADNSTYCRYPLNFPVTMRTAPTIGTTGTAGNYMNLTSSGAWAASAVPSLESSRPQGVSVILYSSGFSTGASTFFRNSTSTSVSFLTFSAEL